MQKKNWFLLAVLVMTGFLTVTAGYFLEVAPTKKADQAPVSRSTYSGDAILNRAYNPTNSTLQVKTTARGIATPGTTTLSGDAILNKVYDGSGALQIDLNYPITTSSQQSYSLSASNISGGRLFVNYTSAALTTVHLMTDLLVSGQQVTISDIAGKAGTKPILIDTQGAETIDGHNTISLSGKYASVDLFSNGANWFINGYSSPVKAGTNLVVDGDCTAVTAWTAANGSIASVAGGQTGNACQLTMSSGASQYFYQDIAVVPGKTYLISGYVKSGTSGNETSRINPADGITTAAGIFYNWKTTSASWVQYSIVFQAQSATLRLYLFKYTATAGTMLFDTIEMYELY